MRDENYEPDYLKTIRAGIATYNKEMAIRYTPETLQKRVENVFTKLLQR